MDSWRLSAVLLAFATTYSAAATKARLGARLPTSFELPTVTPPSRMFRLAQLRGNVVVLQFWGSACAPCQEEPIVLDKVLARYAGRPVQAVLVGADEGFGARNEFPQFLQQHPLRLIAVRDVASGYTGGRTQSWLCGVSKLPTTFVLDKTGVVRYIHEGHSKSFEASIEREIKRLL